MRCRSSLRGEGIGLRRPSLHSIEPSRSTQPRTAHRPWMVRASQASVRVHESRQQEPFQERFIDVRIDHCSDAILPVEEHRRTRPQPRRCPDLSGSDADIEGHREDLARANPEGRAGPWLVPAVVRYLPQHRWTPPSSTHLFGEGGDPIAHDSSNGL